MKWYDAVRDFLYVHPWLQGLIFGSLIAIAGGGSLLHRRKELKHAKDLVEANRKIADANNEANTFREEANRLSEGLLEVHTAQAETAKLIGHALNQQGNVLDEQTKIMAKQFELQRRVETKVERDSLFTAMVEMQGALVSLERRLSRISLSNVTQKDSDEVLRYFEKVSDNAVACMKELMTAVHISKEEKEYFGSYSKKLSDLKYSGDMRKTFEDVKVIRDGTPDLIFFAKLGDLAKTPEIG
jgi:hypothetical protein